MTHFLGYRCCKTLYDPFKKECNTMKPPSKLKRQAIKWMELLAKHVSDNEFVSRISKEVPEFIFFFLKM